jgi:hypothetical protein
VLSRRQEHRDAQSLQVKEGLRSAMVVSNQKVTNYKYDFNDKDFVSLLPEPTSKSSLSLTSRKPKNTKSTPSIHKNKNISSHVLL